MLCILALAPLLPLWHKRASWGLCRRFPRPYRDRRSHFDGQDLLEAGTTRVWARLTAAG